MVWAIVSSRSCFCWLYSAASSAPAKNIINLISVLTIWCCPGAELSLVLLEEGVCYDQCILLAKLCYPEPCFILYKAKLACFRYLLTSYFCILVLCDEKNIFFLGGGWVLVLEDLVGLFTELFSFRFFRITGWGIYLDYCDSEWFALEWNWGHFVVFEIALKYCISDSCIDYGGYSISSKGFLPTVVDINSHLN